MEVEAGTEWEAESGNLEGDGSALDLAGVCITQMQAFINTC